METLNYRQNFFLFNTRPVVAINDAAKNKLSVILANFAN